LKVFKILHLVFAKKTNWKLLYTVKWSTKFEGIWRRIDVVFKVVVVILVIMQAPRLLLYISTLQQPTPHHTYGFLQTRIGYHTWIGVLLSGFDFYVVASTEIIGVGMLYLYFVYTKVTAIGLRLLG